MIQERVNHLSPHQREFLASRIAARESAEHSAESRHRPLIAWFTAAEGIALTAGALREHISERLPSSLIPRHFVQVELLPRTATGKINRRQLSESVIRQRHDDQRRTASRTSTEDTLIAIWAQVLGTTQFSVDDNFFEVGGDSLSIIKVIALGSESGLHVTPTVFHENPTIRQLATALEREASRPSVLSVSAPTATVKMPERNVVRAVTKSAPATTDKPVMPLCLSSHTDKPVVFLIPPKGMAVSEFRHVVPHITDYSCYAPVIVRNDAADHWTVEELADQFLRQLRALQPTGPYRLAGTCEGAYIAWEMACRLSEAGDDVEFLGIIDTPNPAAMSFKPLAQRIRLRLKSLNGRSLAAKPFHIIRRAASWAARRAKQTVVQEHHLTRAGSRMGWKFVPRSLDGRAVLFRACRSVAETDFVSDAMHGWDALATEGLDVCSLPCTRLEMLQPPFASLLAARLQSAIAAIEAGNNGLVSQRSTKISISPPSGQEARADSQSVFRGDEPVADHQPLRILVGAAVPPNPDSGASGTVFQMNRALRDVGHHVDEIWAGDLGRRIQHGNLHYIFELPLAYRRELRRAMKQHDYDVVEFNQPHAWLAAADFQKSRSAGVFINRSHGHEVRYEQSIAKWQQVTSSVRNPLREFCSHLIRCRIEQHWNQVVKFSDGIIVSSQQDAQFLQRHHGMDQNRIGIISQGVPDEFLVRPVRDMTTDRLSRLIYVGNFAPYKGPLVLADCVNQILTAHPDARFTWVCDTNDHQDAWALLQPAIRDRVQMLGWMTQGELINLLDSHGILLFPSLFEGFGKTPLEAMSRGLCVIASDIAGMHDYITDEIDGYLTPTGASAPIIHVANRLLQSPESAMQIARAAVDFATQHTWTRAAEAAVQFYRSCVAQKNGLVESSGR